MLTLQKTKEFANGKVYALKTDDGYLIETTDTFLPMYTKDAINSQNNSLTDIGLGSRAERWMIGVSTMSGCPVHCKFCATGMMKKWRNLTAIEIVEQVDFILSQNPEINFGDAQEHKINYTRMGEPFLNIDAVKEAIKIIDSKYPNTHHYISTIGIKNADYSWIKDNITLQISLHSLKEDKRNWLIPYNNKDTIADLGTIRTQSNLKTTLNLTLVDVDDFNIDELKKYFSSKNFFIKLSPINTNKISEKNCLNTGIIKTKNIR